MNWLIGIAAVMILAHLYFRRGTRKLERDRKAEPPHPPAD